MANKPITDAELDELIALSDGPKVLHWGLLNRALRELRESRWSEITPENLPRVGDELLGIDGNSGKVFELIIVTEKMVKEWDAEAYIADWLPFFRPINAPSPKEAA